MEKSNQIQIGMLGVIILMLLYMMFAGGMSNSTASASTKSDRDAARQSLAQNSPAKKDAAKPVEPPVPTGPKTEMKFEETEFDFGNLTAGESVTHMFKFTNTGKEPLIISNAKGSCGCTVPQWPKEPIAPGETGEIEVKYNSKGKKGKESKNVTITANTEPVNTILKISAEVAPDPNAPAQPAAVKGGKPTITPQIKTNN